MTPPLLPKPLLGPDDPSPTETTSGRSPALLIVCDHGGRAVPRRLAGLGLAEPDLARHIAWDIGAEAVARALAARFDASLICARYSRLVIDANRYPGDPASVALHSDGTHVPGNAALAPADRERRVAEIFRPYHDRIAQELDRLTAGGVRPLLLSVHSMTDRPASGAARRQQIAVSWAEDDGVAACALSALARDPSLTVGDNQPYAIDYGIDYTVPEHAVRRGLPHLQIEFRQDLLADPAGIDQWADRFAPALVAVLAFVAG